MSKGVKQKPIYSNFGFTNHTNIIDLYGSNRFFYSNTMFSTYIKLDGYNNNCFLIITKNQREFLRNILKKTKINYEEISLTEWKLLIKDSNAYFLENNYIDIINMI
jgi:hypothetical protein